MTKVASYLVGPVAGKCQFPRSSLRSVHTNTEVARERSFGSVSFECKTAP